MNVQLTVFPPHMQPGLQCGGKGWQGRDRCRRGLHCVEKDPYYSQCLPLPDESGGQQLYGQCGGKGWQGPFTCANKATCQYINDWCGHFQDAA